LQQAQQKTTIGAGRAHQRRAWASINALFCVCGAAAPPARAFLRSASFSMTRQRVAWNGSLYVSADAQTERMDADSRCHASFHHYRITAFMPPARSSRHFCVLAGRLGGGVEDHRTATWKK